MPELEDGCQRADDRGQQASVVKCKPQIREMQSDTHVRICSAKDLIVYQKAYALAMRIFAESKKFPAEEKYSLTDQIRRSSRSVCSNLREAWAKRRYPAHFISKLSDCDGENAETDSWLNFARDCGYFSEQLHGELAAECEAVGRMLGTMMSHPERFLPRSLD